MIEKRLIGIEVGGTKLQAVLGTVEGQIITRHRASVVPEQGAAGILGWMESAIDQILSETPQGDAVIGIAVGFGGPVERSTGRVLTSHQIAGWDGVLLKNRLEDRYAVPTLVENDANAAGWAEYCQGAGRGTRNFVYCNIGSGIGGAFVAEGTLYNGQGFGACEIGHTYVADWTSPVPGAVDKLEHLCSGWSITRRIRTWQDLAPESPLHHECGGNPATLTCPMLAEAARQGDPRAAAELDVIAAGIGAALTNVVTLLHPERIALGGGVALMGPVLLDRIDAYIDDHVFAPYRKRYTLVPCELEEDVVTVGALLLAGLDPDKALAGHITSP